MNDLRQDLFGLAGLGLLTGGTYLEFGLNATLMLSGAILLTLAVAGAWRRRSE